MMDGNTSGTVLVLLTLEHHACMLVVFPQPDWTSSPIKKPTAALHIYMH